jgi:CTP:molybdopterin cytidylyltransferase MocA
VDTPLFSAALVRLLSSRMSGGGDHIITPFYEGKSGHPVLIRSAAVKELLKDKNSRGLRGAIDAYNGPRGSINVDESGILFDADTPEDYRRMCGL